MCGDGRLVDMKAHVNGRLGGIEAGACGAYGPAPAAPAVPAVLDEHLLLSFFTLYILFVRTVVRWYDI